MSAITFEDYNPSYVLEERLPELLNFRLLEPIGPTNSNWIIESRETWPEAAEVEISIGSQLRPMSDYKRFNRSSYNEVETVAQANQLSYIARRSKRSAWQEASRRFDEIFGSTRKDRALRNAAKHHFSINLRDMLIAELLPSGQLTAVQEYWIKQRWEAWTKGYLPLVNTGQNLIVFAAHN